MLTNQKGAVLHLSGTQTGFDGEPRSERDGADAERLTDPAACSFSSPPLNGE
jgi:hypothetical protein